MEKDHVDDTSITRLWGAAVRALRKFNGVYQERIMLPEETRKAIDGVVPIQDGNFNEFGNPFEDDHIQLSLVLQVSLWFATSRS